MVGFSWTDDSYTDYDSGVAIDTDGHNLTATYKDGYISFYVDDILAKDPEYKGKTIKTNDYSLCIGKNAEATGRYFDGAIDEVKVSDDKNSIMIGGSSGKYMHGKHSWKVEGQSS